jgi:hypothetical protein
MSSLLRKISKSQRRFLFVAAAILVVGVIYLRYRHKTEGFQVRRVEPAPKPAASVTAKSFLKSYLSDAEINKISTNEQNTLWTSMTNLDKLYPIKSKNGKDLKDEIAFLPEFRKSQLNQFLQDFSSIKLDDPANADINSNITGNDLTVYTTYNNLKTQMMNASYDLNRFNMDDPNYSLLKDTITKRGTKESQDVASVIAKAKSTKNPNDIRNAKVRVTSNIDMIINGIYRKAIAAAINNLNSQSPPPPINEIRRINVILAKI